MRAHKSCYVDAQRANSQCRPGGSEVLCEKVRLILRLWSKNGSVRWPLSHVELILAMNQPMLSARPKFVKDAQDALTAVVDGQNGVPDLTGQVPERYDASVVNRVRGPRQLLAKTHAPSLSGRKVH